LKEQYKETFDFNQHQLKEQQEEEKKAAAINTGEVNPNDLSQNSSSATNATGEQKPKYDKTSGFFDQISNSTQKKNDQNEARSDFRKKDAETFGL
jgi:hypothetical protein